VVRDALAGALDDAAFPTDAAAVLAGTSTPAGTLQRVGTDLTWTGDLATGTAVWITYTMVVLSPAAGDKYMTDKVSADVPGSTCPTGTTAASCSASVVVLTPALQIVKTADDVTTTVPGGTVRYTIVATNVGQVPYTGITVTDALADVLDDAAYNNDASARTAGVDVGTIGLQGTDLGWTGDLALGAAVTITYSVVVGSPPAGNRQLLNVVRRPGVPDLRTRLHPHDRQLLGRGLHHPDRCGAQHHHDHQRRRHAVHGRARHRGRRQGFRRRRVRRRHGDGRQRQPGRHRAAVDRHPGAGSRSDDRHDGGRQRPAHR
jgi:uncharacterized repeat protein (TIGR01451 family)